MLFLVLYYCDIPESKYMFNTWHWSVIDCPVTWFLVDLKSLGVCTVEVVGIRLKLWVASSHMQRLPKCLVERKVYECVQREKMLRTRWSISKVSLSSGPSLSEGGAGAQCLVLKSVSLTSCLQDCICCFPKLEELLKTVSWALLRRNLSSPKWERVCQLCSDIANYKT